MGGLEVTSLLFANDFFLLAPSEPDLKHTLECFAADFEVVGMKLSTSKSEAMVLF